MKRRKRRSVEDAAANKIKQLLMVFVMLNFASSYLVLATFHHLSEVLFVPATRHLEAAF